MLLAVPLMVADDAPGAKRMGVQCSSAWAVDAVNSVLNRMQARIG